MFPKTPKPTSEGAQKPDLLKMQPEINLTVPPNISNPDVQNTTQCLKQRKHSLASHQLSGGYLKQDDNPD